MEGPGTPGAQELLWQMVGDRRQQMCWELPADVHPLRAQGKALTTSIHYVCSLLETTESKQPPQTLEFRERPPPPTLFSISKTREEALLVALSSSPTTPEEVRGDFLELEVSWKVNWVGLSLKVTS